VVMIFTKNVFVNGLNQNPIVLYVERSLIDI